MKFMTSVSNTKGNKKNQEDVRHMDRISCNPPNTNIKIKLQKIGLMKINTL
jgi:hypothetical protein